MMWRPFVFSKLKTSPGGGIDEMHFLTEMRDGDLRCTKEVSYRSGLSEERSVAFIHNSGHELRVGVDGSIMGILGEDHPFAHEVQQLRRGPQKGRPITFIQGYAAHRGTSIPALDDLLTQQPKLLDQILSQANAEGAVRGKPIKVSPVTFISPRTPGTEWDTIAKEFEAGEHTGRTATFTKDGKLFRWLEPEVEKVVAQRILDPVEKKSPTLESPSKIAFLPFAAISLAVLAAGWLVREILKKLKSHGRSDHRGR